MPVWAFGYPLVRPELEPSGDKGFHLYPRYLEGYVSRKFVAPNSYPSVELGMPCPPGLSGAPLVIGHTEAEVVGLVYGRETTALGDEPPYIFGLAYDWDTLAGVSGTATKGKRLADLL
jgi:hypothetical protein